MIEFKLVRSYFIKVQIVATIKDEIYTDEPVDIDGKYFFKCKFTRCTLVYSGGDAPSFDKCSFDSPQFSFRGAAGNTLGFMQELYHSIFRSHIEKTFENIIGNRRAASLLADKEEKADD